MVDKLHERVEHAIGVIEKQSVKLRQLHEEYYSGYDAAFDSNSAYASLQRWADRTFKLLQEHVGKSEATIFYNTLKSAPMGRGSWRWGEVCQYLDTYLLRLAEDIEENPDDPSFDNLTDPHGSTQVPRASALKHFDVFLSYSTRDKDEARKICAALEKKGRSCFLAERNLKPGDLFSDEIRNAIKESEIVWILVSPDSIKSDWVQREASAAWALDMTSSKFLYQLL